MPRIRSLADLGHVQGKTALVRCDLNVPLANGVVTNDARLRAILPTLKALQNKSCKIVLLAHLGRPNGTVSTEYSLAPVAQHLNGMFSDTTVHFSKDCIGDSLKTQIKALADGEILVCENLRFHAEEKNNDPDFAKKLADLGDFYVGDAFSNAHRTHASMVSIPKHLPAYAGTLMMAELSALRSALKTPKSPVTAIVGGAKVSTKLSVLGHLIKKMDTIIVGGGMANTFLYAKGYNVGASLYEPDMADEANALIQDAIEHNCTIYIPQDVVVATEFAENAPHRIVSVEQIETHEMALDIGPKSIEDIKNILNQTKTLLWNGPLGAFETKPFDTATSAVAKYAALRTVEGNLISIGGGGDTVAALETADAAKDLSYISTAGGAFLEYIEGKSLPAIDALLTTE